MENKYFLSGVVLILGITAILADVPMPSEVKGDEIDYLLKKSEEQLNRVTIVAKMVDRVTSTKVEEMNEQIEVLEEQNEVLVVEKETLKTFVEQAQKAYNEMVIKYDSAPTKRFDILAIISDSTNRGE